MIVDSQGFEFYAIRDLGDGREIQVVPLTFGRARLCVGPKGSPCYDDSW